MEMNGPVSFKSWLYRSTSAVPEIRRFAVDNGASTNYKYLQQKIETIYSNLGSQYDVQWKDDEDDFVTISTDEELMEGIVNMLQHQHMDTVHIYIRTKQANDDMQYDPQGGELHPHVVCDSCDGEVRGFRYKCVQCPDYDLCWNCEKKGLHHTHNMMRVVSPADGSFGFGQKFRFGPKCWGFGPGRQWGRGRGARGCHFGGAAHGGNRGGPHGFHWENFPGGSAGWGMFDNMWSGWAGSSDGTDHKQAENQQQQSSAPDGATGSNSSQQQSTPDGATGKQQQQPPQAEFLRNVGDFVANLLDPLGINVDVDVSTNETDDVSKNQKKAKKCKGKCKKHHKENQKSSDAGESVDQDTCTQTDPTCAEECENKETSELVDTPTCAEECESKETSELMDTAVDEEPRGSEDEWDVVRREEETENPQSTEATRQSGIYPDLPTGPPKPEIPPSTDPQIAHALELMMSMGFQNEGGWLLGLLENKGGDIGKVLDALKPVRN